MRYYVCPRNFGPAAGRRTDLGNDVEPPRYFTKRAPNAPGLMAPRLSHTDARGRVHMVDVGGKPETERQAIASAAVRMSPATLALAMGRPGAAKGDVLATARVAAITALKRTAEWIPLCHPVRVVGTDVALEADDSLPGIRIRVTVRAFDRTGVEMEALVGACEVSTDANGT
jgi:cyclic pyranopterin phosphate synthase